MNFIEFTTDHWSYNEDQQEYWLEIPKDEIGDSIKSVQMMNDDGSIADAPYEIREDHLTFTVSVQKPCNIRVSF